jgi:broad specificity phosphatase PhoE
MRIYLVRHGEMAGDPYARPARPVIGCLSARGVQQARATAQALSGARLDVALSSPYGRALQTAEIVMTGHSGAAVRIIDAFHEWLPAPEVRALTSTEFGAMQQRDRERYAEETWKTEQGEGAFDMYARVVPALLAGLASLGLHHRMGAWQADAGAEELGVAIVAHGGSLNVMLAFLLGVPPFPVGCFAFDMAGCAEIGFSVRRGLHYPVLRLPAPAAQPDGTNP